MRIKTNTTCGKAGYTSYGKAEKQIRRALKNRKTELRSYHCAKCGTYHLTHIQDFNKHVLALREEEQDVA